MATYAHRQELWITSSWETHGILRAEYLGEDGRWIRFQYDDGSISENVEQFVYRAKRHAIASVVSKARTAIMRDEEALPKYRANPKAGLMIGILEAAIVKHRAIIAKVTA